MLFHEPLGGVQAPFSCPGGSSLLSQALCGPLSYVQVPFQVTGAAWGGESIAFGCGQLWAEHQSSCLGAVFAVPSICGAGQPTHTDLC